MAFITSFKLIQRKHVWYKYLLTKVRLFFKKQGENHDHDQLPFYYWHNLHSRAVRCLSFTQARGLFLTLLYVTYQLFSYYYFSVSYYNVLNLVRRKARKNGNLPV